MYDVITCNSNTLWYVISLILEKHPAEDNHIWNASWGDGKYNPTPTIIEATCYRYVNIM